MRLRWVGDSRDYVKWDCVFGSAGGRFVFYVPMLRWSVDPKCIHPQVHEHFDGRKGLDQFGELFPGRFAVFDFHGGEYSRSVADEYFQSVIRDLEGLQQSNDVLVFIDPDTGIQPGSGIKDEHLRSADLCSIFDALTAEGRLIVYQHASRVTGWKENLLNRATEVLNIELTPAKNLYFDERLAKDVCFLVLDKPKS